MSKPRLLKNLNRPSAPTLSQSSLSEPGNDMFAQEADGHSHMKTQSHHIQPLTNPLKTIGPISQLPAELLLAIFRLNHEEGIEGSEDYHHFRDILCQVSRHWRNLVLKDSQFWTSICATFNTPLEKLECHLQRAQDFPLHLYLHLTQWGSSPSEDLLRIVTEQLGRCHLLSLTYTYFTASIILKTLKLTSAESLMSLKLEQVRVTGGQSFSGAWVVDGVQQLPSLTSLQLLQDQMIILKPPALTGWRTLRTLHVSGPISQDLDSLFPLFLSALSNLEDLTITSRQFEEFEPRTIALPSLRTLTIGHGARFELFQFIPALCSPRLESLTLLDIEDYQLAGALLIRDDLIEQFPILRRLVVGGRISAHRRRVLPIIFPHITDFTLIMPETFNAGARAAYIFAMLSEAPYEVIADSANSGSDASSDSDSSSDAGSEVHVLPPSRTVVDLPWLHLERLAVEPTITPADMELVLARRLSLGYPITEWA